MIQNFNLLNLEAQRYYFSCDMVKYKEGSFASDSELVCLTIAEKTLANKCA